MRKATAFLISILLASALPHYAYAAEPKTAQETIQAFYKTYLSYNYHLTPNLPPPRLQFSTSFNAAIAKNDAICQKYVQGICGWAAEGDEYLNTQETDPKLTYQNSGIKITATSANVIQVKLNVYPSVEDTDGYYLKTITYKMIQENGIWVADDIFYEDGVSSRKRMDDENAAAIVHPDFNK